MVRSQQLRRCHATMSSTTESVILEMVSRLMSVPYISSTWAWMSPHGHALGGREITGPLSPSNRRWPLGTLAGVHVA